MPPKPKREAPIRLPHPVVVHEVIRMRHLDPEITPPGTGVEELATPSACSDEPHGETQAPWDITPHEVCEGNREAAIYVDGITTEDKRELVPLPLFNPFVP